MPRYLIERAFPQGLSIPQNADGAAGCMKVVANNAEQGVTWLHSYVEPEHKHTWCIYDGPSPEAVRAVAKKNGLPIERITEVSVLNPYFYRA